MKKYWYKYYTTQYSQMLKTIKEDNPQWLAEVTQWLIDELEAGKELLADKLWVTVNTEAISYYEGKVNAINQLLGKNEWIYPASF